MLWLAVSAQMQCNKSTKTYIVFSLSLTIFTLTHTNSKNSKNGFIKNRIKKPKKLTELNYQITPYISPSSTTLATPPLLISLCFLYSLKITFTWMEDTEVRVGDAADRTRGADVASASGAGGGGARYKLMSPAKLPISRSPCIMIPPGLSPSSFLESPVLLSNVKVSYVFREIVSWFWVPFGCWENAGVFFFCLFTVKA